MRIRTFDGKIHSRIHTLGTLLLVRIRTLMERIHSRIQTLLEGSIHSRTDIDGTDPLLDSGIDGRIRLGMLGGTLTCF
jgi:hypothetical protein